MFCDARHSAVSTSRARSDSRVQCSAMLMGKSSGAEAAMGSWRRRIAAALTLCLLSRAARAQSGPASECGLPSPSFVTGAPNIFNAQQEQDLGDALAEREETEVRIVPPLPDDQLTRIGERLVATLPPS